MTLEASLDALTAALNANTAALLGQGAGDAPAAAAPGRKSRKTATTESAPPAAAPASPASAPAAAPVTPQPAASAAATLAAGHSTPAPNLAAFAGTPPAGVTLKQWTDKFVELGELGDAGRADAIAIIQGYGAARASLIPADKYAEAYEKAVAAIAKHKAPAPASAASLV